MSANAASDFERLLEVPLGDLNAAVMVISIDGVVAVDGRVGGLTGAADQRLLLGMRERAQAVVVERAATVRAEGYGGLLPAAARQRRATAGLSPQPELAVVTRSPDGIAGTEAALAPDLQVRLEQPPTNRDGGPDLRVVSAGIRDRHGTGLVWEGGPTLVRGSPGVLGELFSRSRRCWRAAGCRSRALRPGLAAPAICRRRGPEGFVFLRIGLRTLSK